ncbi:type VI secretion system ATPase TssH [Ignatzschineria larvae DSM 13226]|uniref:Type VI secretion system ATPase TssH n=1 Tax=Ignatzschineria larvae DSM 13226 TaxID=1111732 RepID=A0ABZ3C1B1_9GAMM|nr:type VI secretion system ATPase TssH [Ignatzschineria larvae]
MIRVDLSIILSKLGDIHKVSLENASTLCIERQNSEVGVLHLLYSLLESPLNDCRVLMEDLGFDIENIRLKIARHIPTTDDERDVYPTFSPLLIDALQDAWLLSTTELAQTQLRSGAFFLAILLQIDRYLPIEFKVIFSNINRENFRQNFTSLLANSAENDKNIISSNKNNKSPLLTSESNLYKYTIDLTQQAIDGKLDPVFARDEEIYLMIDILSRRRKNNPIVVGDAGVGKSALIEGLAQKIACGNVPDTLRDVRLLMLDLGLLQAGASIKGEFEKRLKGIIDEVQTSEKPIILFVDEVHTLIGAGNNEGGADAANLLKPALARGELRTIGATTWREYKKYFEKDPALSRRFQMVMVNEPSVDNTINILRGLRTTYEKSHNVIISDKALRTAAILSDRYLTGRQLPDKAIDILDTACARVAINFNVPPLVLTKLKNKLSQLNLEKILISREILFGNKQQERYEELLQEENLLTAEIETLKNSWRDQKILAKELMDLREKVILSKNDTEKAKIAALLESKNTQINSLDTEDILVHSVVDETQISAVISDWTGIPISKMKANDLVRLTELPSYLEESIKGQSAGIHKIHQRLLTARADLHKQGRPQGAFLLVGPSGVGKTETALQIANLLYGGRQFLTTINMSEYQEKHTISRLIGSPPGYVGYGEGGVLTEAIRQKPYSIVLLDEVEKGHPEILNIFYQVFDKGEILDGEGRLIDCQNILFFMTSNLGYKTIVEHHKDSKKLHNYLYQELEMFFQPALLARVEIVPYLPLSNTTMKEIVVYKLNQLKESLRERYNAQVVLSDLLVPSILEKITCVKNGARMIEAIIEGKLLPSLSLKILQKLSRSEQISNITLNVKGDGSFTSEVS